MRRTHGFILAATMAALVCAPAARAQTYPDRSIRLIVPYVPGSPVDAIARVVTNDLHQRLGQTVVIENRPGGGTTIGTKAAVTAPADGYTLLFMAPQLAFMAITYPNLGFDPVQAFAPVATVVTWSHVLVVDPNLPVKTVAELVAYAKANPGKVAFGFGLNTTPHLLGETFKRAAGIELTSVPYRGGEGARADLLGGRIQMNIAPVSSLRALIEEGKVRPLAFTGPQRSAVLPDVPTMAESGYPTVSFNPDVWLAIAAPAGTPASIIATLNHAVNDGLRSPAMRETLAKLAVEPMITTPEEMAAFLAAEVKKWPPIIEASGVTPN